MTSTPQLSVCIPTYNRADLLERTLGALLAEIGQRPIEVIVSDNASSDRTRAVVAEANRRDPRVAYLGQPENIGLDANSMAALQHARGEYVWFLSDDDVPLPGGVDRILSLLTDRAPVLLYLNHAGFLETEAPTTVRARHADLPDFETTNGEALLVRYRLTHFSALVVNRAACLRHLDDLAFYARSRFGRGYAAIVLAHFTVLREPGPKIFSGHLSLAVRNELRISYDVVQSVLADSVRHVDRLVALRLLGRSAGREYVNYVLRGVYSIVLAQRLGAGGGISGPQRRALLVLLAGYPMAYLTVFPFLLLPRPALVGLRRLFLVLRSRVRARRRAR
jgi:glycosyltransferase involved in cell wall biosynthesis